MIRSGLKPACCTHLDAEAQRMLALRIGELIDYQDVEYATAYVDFVLEVAAREAGSALGVTS